MTNFTLADQYATLKAQRDELDAQIEAIKAEIVASGAELIEGDLYNVKVHLRATKVVDEVALAEHGVTVEQLKVLNACKKDGKIYPVLDVKPRVALAA